MLEYVSSVVSQCTVVLKTSDNMNLPLFDKRCNGVFYFYSKTNQMHQCLKFISFWNKSTCFGQSFLPSSGVRDCTYSNRHLSNRYCWQCLLLYVESWTPDDGRKDCPKHVECHLIWYIGASTGFYYRNNITMHGPMNVENVMRLFVGLLVDKLV